MEEYKWILIGTLFLITGVVLYLAMSGLRKNGVKTKAKVKKHKRESDDEGSFVYEVFEFEDKNGELHRSKSLFGTSFKQYDKGQIVEIIYDQSNPKKVIPNNSYLLHIYIAPIILGLILVALQFIMQ